eukprot:715475-Amphidinium_carterae.1
MVQVSRCPFANSDWNLAINPPYMDRSANGSSRYAFRSGHPCAQCFLPQVPMSYNGHSTRTALLLKRSPIVTPTLRSIPTPKQE